jgi:hypothetical protein
MIGLGRFWLFSLVFGFLAPKDFCIIWLSYIVALSIRDEGYSKNSSCALGLISAFSFDNVCIRLYLIMSATHCNIAKVMLANLYIDNYNVN